MKRIAILLTLALSLMLPTAVSAGKATVSISNPAPVRGNTITVSVEGGPDVPFFGVECFQNGDLVFADGRNRIGVFTLDSEAWSSGDLQCTATVYRNVGQGANLKPVGSLSFTVAE